MFNNIGEKIKGLAVVACWIGIIACAIVGISFVTLIKNDGRWVGVIIIVVGSLLSWIGSFVLYGFGELICRTSAIDEKIDIFLNSKPHGENMGNMISTFTSTANNNRVPTTPGVVKCPECGAMESSAHSNCYKCGADLHKKTLGGGTVESTGGWNSKDWE